MPRSLPLRVSATGKSSGLASRARPQTPARARASASGPFCRKFLRVDLDCSITYLRYLFHLEPRGGALPNIRQQIADNGDGICAGQPHLRSVGASDAADRDQWLLSHRAQATEFFATDHRIGVCFRAGREDWPDGKVVDRLLIAGYQLLLVVSGKPDESFVRQRPRGG